MKAALYARVSTRDKDQNPEVQLAKLREYCQAVDWEVYREYVDQASAGDIVGRKQWSLLMKEASMHKFDVLVVWKSDRAFRSVNHAANTLKMLKAYNVGFRSFTESHIDTTTPMGEAIFYITVVFAEIETANLRERIKAGMDHAKQHGTRTGNAIGRKRYNIPFTIICKALKDANGSWSEAAKLITKETGIKVSPGFVQIRVQRDEGLTKEEVLAGAPMVSEEKRR